MYLSETIHSVQNFYSLTIKSIELLSFRKISSHLFSREFHTISKITIERERVFDVAISSQMPFWFCSLSHSVHHFSNECMSKIEFFKFISFESLLVQLWNFSCISAIFVRLFFRIYDIHFRKYTMENMLFDALFFHGDSKSIILYLCQKLCKQEIVIRFYGKIFPLCMWLSFFFPITIYFLSLSHFLCSHFLHLIFFYDIFFPATIAFFPHSTMLNICMRMN